MVTQQSSENIWYLNEPDSSGIYYNLVLLDSSRYHGSVNDVAHYEVIQNFDLVIPHTDVKHLSYVHDDDGLHGFVTLVAVYGTCIGKLQILSRVFEERN